VSNWETLKASVAFLDQNVTALSAKDQAFATSLREQFHERGLSAKQEYWANTLADRARENIARAAVVQAPAAKIDLTRIVELFKTASTNLKKPFIRVHEGDWKIKLALAGPSSKYAGQVYVYTDAAFEERLWLGRVDPAQRAFIPSRDLSTGGAAAVDDVTRILVAFAADPVGHAVKFGRKVGACCFCSRQLNDPRSVTMGYGPICADHFGLPWGEVVEVKDFETDTTEELGWKGGATATGRWPAKTPSLSNRPRCHHTSETNYGAADHWNQDEGDEIPF